MRACEKMNNDVGAESRQRTLRYIDEAEFIKRIKPYDTNDSMDKALYNFAYNHMVETPTANVVERKRGRWIQRSDTPWYYYCSNCHRVISVISAEQMKKFHAFCGTCGADMREEIEDE